MSDEFIIFLRQRNKVVFECEQWIVIENCKYHTKKAPWLTAFHKPKNFEGTQWTEWYDDMDILWWHNPEWRDWKWVKKEKRKQTVKRFHFHIIKEYSELPE